MKSVKKLIAVLLIVTITLVPLAGLAENAFDALKNLVDTPQTDITLASGYSIFNDPDSDTSDGVLCMIMFGDESNVMMISGINGSGKYEIRMYSDLSLIQMLYYSFVVSSNYSKIQSKLKSGAQYTILVTYGEDGVILITDAQKAAEFRDTFVSATEQLANQ